MLDEVVADYERAEVTAAVIHDRSTNRYTILFAVAELCPAEQPRSEVFGEQPQFARRETLEGKTSSLFLVRRFMSCADAVTFFRGADGIRTLEGAGGPLHTAGPLRDLSPEQEPVLIPSNITERDNVGAVLPRRHTAIAVLSKYDTGGAARAMLPAAAMRRAKRLLRRLLDIDLEQLPEHVGAIHLCFSNPHLRGLETSVGADGRTLLVRCFERRGRSCAGCELEVSSKWSGLGSGFRVRKILSSSCETIELPAPPHNFQLRMFDARGRCIEEESRAIVGGFNVNAELYGTRQVVLKRADGSEETYDVTSVELASKSSTLAGRSDLAPLSMLVEAKRARELGRLAAKGDFHYFPGGAESRRAAYEVVRQLLRGVRHRCDIVDPYLDSDDVASFVPFVGANRCPVRLLSSAAYLSGEHEKGGPSHERRLVERVAEFRGLGFSVEARKVRGKDKSPVHDRILFVDDDAYLLGSSLNEFGARATTLFRVPHSALLRAEFEDWWSGAPKLAAQKAQGES